MALTKNDLQQIRSIVREEVRDEVKVQLDPVHKEIKTIKKDIVHIRKDINTIINFFDREYLELRSRIERIEDYLKLPPSNN